MEIIKNEERTIFLKTKINYYKRQKKIQAEKTIERID